MKLSNLFLSIGAAFLLVGCGGEGDTSSGSTSLPPDTTSTSVEPQVVEFDLPDYRFMASNSEAVLNRVFSFDKTTKEIIVDYYETLNDLKSGTKSATKSFKKPVEYVNSGNRQCDNNTFANFNSGNYTYSFFFVNGFLNGQVLTVDGTRKTVQNLVVDKLETSQVATLFDALGNTFITTSSIDYYNDDMDTNKKAYYLKFEFSNTAFTVYYKTSYSSEWASFPLASNVPLNRFNGSGVVNPSHSGYRLERIVTKNEEKFLEVDKVFDDPDYTGYFTATNLLLQSE